MLHRQCPMCLLIRFCRPPRRLSCIWQRGWAGFPGTSTGLLLMLFLPVLLLSSVFLTVSVASAQGVEEDADQAPAPDLPTYERWLREASGAARRGDRLSLERIATDIVATKRVRLPETVLENEREGEPEGEPGVQTVPVDNSWLRDALDEPEPDLDAIASRLGALLDALARPATAVPGDARQQLHDILNRPPFATTETSGEGTGIGTQILNWFLHLLEQLFKPISQAGGGPLNIVGWLIILLVIGVIGWVLALLLRGMRGSVSDEARRQDDLAASDPTTSASALREARSLAQHNDYRTAVRYLYLSSLLWLEEHGHIRRDPALTNREYLERLPPGPLRTRLQPIVETFDRVWYGYSTLDAAAFADYQQHVENLRGVR